MGPRQAASPDTAPLPKRAIRLATALPATLLAVWPPLVYLGLRLLSVKALALALLALLLLRLGFARLGGGARGGMLTGSLRPTLALGALLAALAFTVDAQLPLKLYPVAVSGLLLASFGASLWRGPPIIERLARLREPDLPPRAVAYTRRLTMAWCAFFVANGAVSLYTALAASDEAWTLYNGVISYGLIGAMFAGERLLRPRLLPAESRDG